MELLTKDDISNIINQIGHHKAISWSFEPHSGEELGYLGEHLSLIVETGSGTLKFFVKCLPRHDKWKAQYLKESTFFDKEYGMLNLLFKQFGPGTKKWRPAVYFAKEEVFVFEDVIDVGYKILRDQDTLAFKEVKACIETMARFHAQSYIYEEKKSEELKRAYRIWEDYSRYLKEPDTTHNWRRVGMNAVVEFIKEYSKYKYVPKFNSKVERDIQNLFDESLRLMEPHSVYRNVVIHRDLWMYNIFFKNENDVLNTIFVDYQTVLYCPPMLDFSSFLYFNTRRDFRDRYIDELIHLYYSSLSEELKASAVNKDVIDRRSLKTCYEDTLSFAWAQAALIVPIALINKKENERIFINPDVLNKFYEVSRSEEFISIAKSDERYRVHLIELFDEIVEKYVL